MKKGVPQTQRNGGNNDTNKGGIGRNSTKHSVNATQSQINPSNILQNHGGSIKTSNHSINKM